MIEVQVSFQEPYRFLGRYPSLHFALTQVSIHVLKNRKQKNSLEKLRNPEQPVRHRLMLRSHSFLVCDTSFTKSKFNSLAVISMVHSFWKVKNWINLCGPKIYPNLKKYGQIFHGIYGEHIYSRMVTAGIWFRVKIFTHPTIGPRHSVRSINHTS